jgi:hypothetical protein
MQSRKERSFKMINKSRYPVRKNFRLRPDQSIWLSKQPNDESTTIRALIDVEIARQEKSKKS